MRFNAICLVLLIITAIGVVIAKDNTVPDGTIYGHVYDAQTRLPVSSAWVYCQETECQKQMTDSDGYYAIENCFSPSTSYDIECTKNGYSTAKNTAKTDSSGKDEVNFNLDPAGFSEPIKAQSWNKTFGKEFMGDSGYSVQQTKDGGYIIAGSTISYGTSYYDQQSNTYFTTSDAWLIKTDSNGNELWNTTFGGSSDDVGYFVQQTQDSGYIIVGENGAGMGDVWLIKTDANGNKLWDKTYGGRGYDKAKSVRQTSDGGYIIVGSTNSYGAGGFDIWLIRTDANGNKLWDKTFGGSKNDEGDSVQQTTDGGYIIGGIMRSGGAGDDGWLIRTDAIGNKLWDITFRRSGNCHSVEQTNDGGFITIGACWPNDSPLGILLNKIDSNGNIEWNMNLTRSKSMIWSQSIQQTNDEGYIIAGFATDAGFHDVYIIKTDANGNKVWDKTFGGLQYAKEGYSLSPYDKEGYSVQQTQDGGYIVVGFKGSYGGYDVWLIKTDSEGN